VLFFNAFDISGQYYLDFENFLYLIKDLELQTVPIEYSDITFTWKTVEELLELARGNYEGTNTPKEGIVIRPAIEEDSYILDGRLSFKVINNDYLLKFDE
jgi:hypothetical protein